jgi:hypothetical protein
MNTVFKVGDVLLDRFGRERGTVLVVEGERVCFRNTLGLAIVSTHGRLSRDFVSRAAPTPFASCTDPATPPACRNETTALQWARQGVLAAAHRYSNGHASVGHIERGLDKLIAAAKAEAIAELARGGAWDTFCKLADERKGHFGG